MLLRDKWNLILTRLISVIFSRIFIRVIVRGFILCNTSAKKKDAVFVMIFIHKVLSVIKFQVVFWISHETRAHKNLKSQRQIKQK